MAYAFLRVEPIRGEAHFSAVDAHNQRFHIPAHADPLRTVHNRSLVTPSPSGTLLDAVEDAIRTETDGWRRRDSILAAEVFMSASSEFFTGGTGARDATGLFDAARTDAWIAASLDFLRIKFGAGCVVSCQVHVDEQTPHIHAVIVPVSPKRRRLSYKELFDGKIDGEKKTSLWQTEYANHVAFLGLKRGKKGSTATHTTVREYHAAVASAHTDAPTVPAPPTPPAQRRRFLGRQTTDEKAEAAEYEKARAAYDAAHAERVAWLEEHADALLARSAELDRVQAELKRQTERATRERARADEIAAEYERYKAEMPRIRAIPLADAIRGCGLAAKKISDSEWIYKKKTLHIDKADPSRGTVTEDGAAPVKVRGGIDLIKNFKGLEAKEAAVFLARHLSVPAVQEDAEAAARERAREWCAGVVVPAVEAEQAAEQRRKAGLEAKRKARAATARSSSTARPSTPRPSASRPSPAEVWREREQRIAARYALAAEASRAQHQQQKMRG